MTDAAKEKETKPVISSDAARIIAAAIQESVVRAIPLDMRMWGINDIAAYLNRSASTIRQRVVCLPDFPRPYRLPGERQQSHPIYKVGEILAWVELYKDTEVLPRQRKRRDKD